MCLNKYFFLFFGLGLFACSPPFLSENDQARLKALHFETQDFKIANFRLFEHLIGLNESKGQHFQGLVDAWEQVFMSLDSLENRIIALETQILRDSTPKNKSFLKTSAPQTQLSTGLETLQKSLHVCIDMGQKYHLTAQPASLHTSIDSSFAFFQKIQMEQLSYSDNLLLINLLRAKTGLLIYQLLSLHSEYHFFSLDTPRKPLIERVNSTPLAKSAPVSLFWIREKIMLSGLDSLQYFSVNGNLHKYHYFENGDIILTDTPKTKGVHHYTLRMAKTNPYTGETASIAKDFSCTVE
jgi:hypothetical protein